MNAVDFTSRRSRQFALISAAFMLSWVLLWLGTSGKIGLPLSGGSKSEGSASATILQLETFESTRYGFSVAVPAGWQHIVAREDKNDTGKVLEPGYAIGFESPGFGKSDQFSDYILIEILPGRASGIFLTDGSTRKPVVIDGRQAWQESLWVDEGEGNPVGVPLFIRQAELVGLGYTIGFFAIGEPEAAEILGQAFEVMLQTFRLNGLPFQVS